MKRAHDPLKLDVATFTAERAELAGEWDGTTLARLAESQTLPQDTAPGAVSWRVRGERRPVTGGDDEVWLTLEARTRVWLACQRCLQPMAETLAVASRIRFVKDEAQAEALDAESDDDVLAMPRVLDLRELVEDELLLALPLVPRHETCPQPVKMSVGEDELDVPDDGAAHPFAALAGLKRGSGGERPD